MSPVATSSLTEQLRTTTVEHLGADAASADLENFRRLLRASWPVGPDAELDVDLCQLYTRAALEGREPRISSASLTLQAIRLAKLLTGSHPFDGPHVASDLTPGETRGALGLLAQSIRSACWSGPVRQAAQALAARAQAAAEAGAYTLDDQAGLAARGLLVAKEG